MVVVAHQYTGAQAVALHPVLQKDMKRQAVLLIPLSIPRLIAPGCQVVPAARSVEAQRSCHDGQDTSTTGPALATLYNAKACP
jgi:hypothetical protein